MVTEVFHNRRERYLWTVLQGVQHLLACMGATIVAPQLMGILPSMAIFTSGVGTLLYVWRTGVPVYMGGSFAYITSIKEVMESYGQGAVAGGILTTAAVSFVVGLAVKKFGYRWITSLMPSIVTANLLIAIGMVLARDAKAMSSTHWGFAALTAMAIFFFALAIKSEFISGLPILGGIAVAYLVALVTGRVDLAPVMAAPLITLPVLVKPVFVLPAMIKIGSVAVATIGENIADLKALAAIFGHPDDLDTRIGDSLVWDAVADAASFSANPSTPYNESIGTTGIAYRPGLTMKEFQGVIYVAGILAVSAGFLGWVTPLIKSIPVGVLGGAFGILLGIISVLGPRLFVALKIDFLEPRNFLVTMVMTVMWIAGAGGVKFPLLGYDLGPIVAVALAGILVNAAFENRKVALALLGLLAVNLLTARLGIPLFAISVSLPKAVLYLAFAAVTTFVYCLLVKKEIDLSSKATQLIAAVIFTVVTATVAGM